MSIVGSFKAITLPISDPVMQIGAPRFATTTWIRLSVLHSRMAAGYDERHITNEIAMLPIALQHSDFQHILFIMAV